MRAARRNRRAKSRTTCGMTASLGYDGVPPNFALTGELAESSDVLPELADLRMLASERRDYL